MVDFRTTSEAFQPPIRNVGSKRSLRQAGGRNKNGQGAVGALATWKGELEGGSGQKEQVSYLVIPQVADSTG